MNWLTAALAFAITMLLFTSMVSAIVESIQRFFGWRSRGLHWMLREMYEEVAKRRPDLVSPLGPAAQIPTTPIQSQTTSEFLELMTKNVGASEFRGWLPHFLRPRHVQSLTPVEFAQRLARTDIGAALAQKAESEWRHLLDGVLERFDFYGQAASETFRQRAKAISIIVSFMLAFALNINALALFYAFANRPQLAEAMTAQRPEIERRFREAERRAGVAPAGSGETDPDATQAREDIKRSLDELRVQFRDQLKLGLPIGWSATRCASNADDEFCGLLRAMPQWQCSEDCGLFDACSASVTYGAAWLSLPFGHTRWLVSTLLAGLLIGLGGPFWYNVCASLSRTAQLVRAVGDGVKGAPPKDGSQAALPPSEVPLLSTPARAFAAAIILHPGSPAPERALLNPKGEPDTGGLR